MNGLRENCSRWEGVPRGHEALVNLDLICAGDPGSNLAGRQGFEPRYRGPEPRVLPLDDLPTGCEREIQN